MENEDWVETGKLGNALQFDGVNEYVNCGAIFDRDRLDPWSIELWVNLVTTGDRNLMGNFSTVDGQSRGIQIYLWENEGKTKPYVVLRADNTHGLNLAGNASLYGGWNHLVITKKAGSSTAADIKFYVNHILVDNDPPHDDSLTEGTTLTGANWLLGRIPQVESYISGKFDEVVLYEKELTQEDVDFRWNGGAGTELLPGGPALTPTASPTDTPAFTPTPADQDAPNSTISLNPAPNAEGWNNSDVTLTINAQDNEGGTGVKEIHYSASGAQIIDETVVSGSTAQA